MSCGDYYYCADTGQSVYIGGSCSIVTARGGMTPKQISQCLLAQCKCGPGGAKGFPCCISGTGMVIKKCQVCSGMSCKVLGWFGCHVTEPASAAWCTIKKDVSALPSVTTVLIILFIAFLASVFVYSFAKSR
jgi:hypothetical protein